MTHVFIHLKSDSLFKKHSYKIATIWNLLGTINRYYTISTTTMTTQSTTTGISSLKTAPVFMILQDQHVSEQRRIYNMSKEVFELAKEMGVIFPSEHPGVNHEWFYFLILKERFDPEELDDDDKLALEGIQHWINTCLYKCNICSLPAMGKMCSGTDLFAGVHIKWDIKK